MLPRFASFLFAFSLLGVFAVPMPAAGAPAAVADSERTWIPAREISGLRFYRELPAAIEYSEVRVVDGDDSRWAQTAWDDRSWRIVTRRNVPRFPIRAGIMWIRFRVRWNDPQGRLPEGFLLWNLSGSYDLYWDGVPVVHSGSPGNSRAEEIEGPSQQAVWIPPSLTGAGEHVVAIRLSTHYALGPARTTPLTMVMMTPSALETNFHRDTILPFMASGALLTIALAALVMWTVAARQRVLLFFGGMCFSAAALEFLTWYAMAYPFPYSWKFPLSLSADGAALALNLCLGATMIAEWSIPRGRRWFALLVFVDAACVMSLPLQSYLRLRLLFGIAFVFVLGCCAWAAWRKKPGAWIVAGAVTLSGISFWRDPLHFVGVDFFQEFLPIVLAVLFAIALRLRAERRRAHHTQLTAARLEIELLKKNLQPHFLMNTLTALAQTVEENPAGAVKLIDDLAEEFRTAARIAGEKIVPVAEELALCRAHLRVMRARTDLDWQLDSEGVDLAAPVPPALFLTLIENGFSHQRSRPGVTTFALRSRVERKRICYTFRSPGSINGGKNRVTGGTGLRYIRARLEESFPGAWTLSQGETTEGWETVVEIPYLPRAGEPA